MHPIRFLVLATCTALGVLAGAGRAGAHGLHAKVDYSGDPIKLEAYYDEELPADLADVTVTDAAGTVVLKGRTDERGLWSFPRPKPGAYKLTVEQIGHVARAKFEIPDGGTEPGAPTTYDGRPLNKWIGLLVGLSIVLGISGVSWLRRRRARRLE